MIPPTLLSSLRPSPRLLTALSGVWAISQDGRESMLADILTGATAGMQAMMAQFDMERIQAKAKHIQTLGMLYDGDEWYFDPTADSHVRESGIGIFPVRGPIFDRGWMCYVGWDQIIETSRQFMREIAVREIMPDGVPITDIIMPIDSPGGMCVGSTAAAVALRELREVCTLHTVANHQVNSAAELIASQGTISYTNPDGNRGHMGAFTTHTDISKMLAEMGVRVEYIKAPEGSVKTFFAEEEEFGSKARAEYRRQVDHYFANYVEQIVQGRGLTPEEIIATQAKIYYGAEAIEIGLAQEESTFDELLMKLETKEA